MGKRAKRASQNQSHKPEKTKTKTEGAYEKAKTKAQEEAARRATNSLPSDFSKIPRFTIDTKEQGGETLKQKLQNFFTKLTARCDDVRATGCEGIPISPPMLDKDPETPYHILVIVSTYGILEVLVRDFDGYVIAIREQPIDLNTRSGWFMFSDIVLPSHLFGEELQNYLLTIDSRYKSPEKVMVGEGFLDNAVKVLLGYTKDNYKEETDEREMALQQLMVLFEEGKRLAIIRMFVFMNLTASCWVPVGLTRKFWITNWSKLSKAIFRLKLCLLAHAIAAQALEDKDIRKKLTAGFEAAVQLDYVNQYLKVFKKEDIPVTPNDFLQKWDLGRPVPTLDPLDLLVAKDPNEEDSNEEEDPNEEEHPNEQKDRNDVPSLPLLTSYVQLLKFEKFLVPHIIMREFGYTDAIPCKRKK